MSVLINKDNVEFAKSFIIQYLKDSGYEGTLEDGTGVYDVLVKAFALLYTMFSQEVEKTSAYLSLQKANELKDSLGTDYDSAVDAIMSNWFITRHDGKSTTGIIRLYFVKPLDFLHIKTEDPICSILDEEFIPSEEYIFTESDFKVFINSEHNRDEYYVDINIKSVNNVELNITTDTAVSGNINNIYFLKAKPVYNFYPGANQESSESFIERGQQSLTTRELITDRAIYTVLMDNYSDLRDVYVAGHGDLEQIRDIVEWDFITVHVGNKADIYLKAPLVKKSINATSDGTVTIEDQIAIVLSVKDSEGDALSFDITTSEAEFGTKLNEPIVNVSSGEVTIYYLTSDLVKEVTDFITNSFNKVSCYDPLVKSAYPVLMDFSIEVRLKPTLKTEEESIFAVKQAIVNYINSIKHGRKYYQSVLIEQVHSNVDEVEKITTPINCMATMFDPKTGDNREMAVDDELGYSDGFIQSDQVSLNTLQFYTDENYIDVTTTTI